MNWLPGLWFGYWWPSIKGNGPEDITSLVIVAIVTGLFVPRVRRWWVAREQALHAKLDHSARLLRHVIEHHPDIPNEDHHGVDLTKENQ